MNNFKWQSVIARWIFLLPLESHLLRTASGLNCPTVSLRWIWSITKPLHRSKSKIEKARTDPARSKLTKSNSGKSSWIAPPKKKGETTWKIASLNTCCLLFWKMLKLSWSLFSFLPGDQMRQLSTSMVVTALVWL